MGHESFRESSSPEGDLEKKQAAAIEHLLQLKPEDAKESLGHVLDSLSDGRKLVSGGFDAEALFLVLKGLGEWPLEVNRAEVMQAVVDLVEKK